MNVPLRRLNQSGLDEFESLRARLGEPGTANAIRRLATDSEGRFTDRLEAPIEVDATTFESRLEVGTYLLDRLGKPPGDAFVRDAGMWAWLAAFWFEQLRLTRGSGPGENARWAFGDVGSRHSYRHLLAGPFQVCRAHSDNPPRALAVLATPVHSPGEIAEQLMANPALVSNGTVMEVATALYIDPNTRRPKPGAAGKGPGSPRRLVAVLNQFDLTWDLRRISPARLKELLPGEFQRFGD